jgi:hypothetical protein
MVQWISGSWMSPRFVYMRISFKSVSQLPLRLTTPHGIASPRPSKLKWFSITPKSKTSNLNWMSGWSHRMHSRKTKSLKVIWEVLMWPWLGCSLLTLDKHKLEKGLPFWRKTVESSNPLWRSVRLQWSLMKF